MAGKRVVVPGFGNKLVSVLPRLLPRGMVLRTIESYQRGRGRARRELASGRSLEGPRLALKLPVNRVRS